MIQALQKRIEELQRAIAKVSSVNVNTASIKHEAIAIGTFYFAECRPIIIKSISSEALISEFDSDLQSLIRLGHGNNPKKRYKKILSKLIKDSTAINIATISGQSNQNNNVQFISNQEGLIISTLNEFVPHASASYQQALVDLNQTESRISFRGTACELRETLREVLDQLASDDDVVKESWYKPEGNKNQPTMKQKVKFILKSRGKGETLRAPSEKTAELIDELVGQVTRSVYDRASLSTHLVTQKGEVEKIKRYVDTLLFDILEIKTR